MHQPGVVLCMCAYALKRSASALSVTDVKEKRKSKGEKTDRKDRITPTVQK